RADPRRRADRQCRRRDGRAAAGPVPVAAPAGHHRAHRHPRPGPGRRLGGRPAGPARWRAVARRRGRMINPFTRGAAPLLPRRSEGQLWLGAVVAVLCFMACLAAVGAVAADRAAHGWARELRGEATVQVRPRLNESGETAAARAAEALSGAPGVTEAEALGREAAEDLLRPWLGDAILPDLPLPHLVVVRLDPEAPADAAALSRVLAEAGLDASVDDHSLWMADVERAAMLVTTLAVIVFMLMA